DRSAVDIELTYATTDVDGFSARLNAFSGTRLQPVRTLVEYLPAAGGRQTLSVTGPPRRVTFDPTALDAVGEAAARGVSAVLSSGDHLLWLLCVLLPVRSARHGSQLVAAMVIGQAMAIVGSALAPQTPGSVAAVAAAIAASALVMAALQNIVRARQQW